MKKRILARVKKPTLAVISAFLLIALVLVFFPGFSQNAEAPIVDAEKIYSTSPFYLGVNKAMESLNSRYREMTELKEIGKSVDGHPILALKIGKGQDKVLVLGGMHGREAITTVLLLDQIEKIILAYKSEDPYSYGGYQTKKILDDVCLWFVPLLNPDGAEISLNRGRTLDNQDLLKYITNGDNDLGRWKANLNGVDLNRNFTGDKYGTVEKAGYAYYPGPKAFSEPETKAIVDFTNRENFAGALNVHAAGEIIYWDMPYKVIAQKISNITGYSLVPPSDNPPMGSYDTWFLRKTGNPVLTIEIGEGFLRAPMEFGKYNSIWQKNWLTPVVFARELQKNQDVAIYYQGFQLQLAFPPIRQPSGQVLVPLRDTMEKIGAEVMWDKKDKTILVRIDEIERAIPQKPPASMVGGTTYIPVSDIIEIFEYKLVWDNYTKSAFLSN
ncbi:MAG: M14 family zinc carboxypeptidase [Anaerovoracaceae bacterium]|jgi:hypothetical protein|nr:M14 family zinc carboxypeptidase [Anaerovoracaceae bacterium]